jgi:hypothetical protein
VFYRLTIANGVTNNHETCGDTHTRSQTLGEFFNFQPAYGDGYGKPRPHRPFDIVLAGMWISKIDEKPVRGALGDIPAVSLNHSSDTAVARGHDLAQIFGIEMRGR